MRSTILLGSVAVGHVAALNVKHASFHARRNAQPQVDYDAVNYDSVNWSSALADIDWSTALGGEKPTAAAPAVYDPAPTGDASYQTSQVKPKPSATSSASKPSSTSTPPSNNGGGGGGDVSALAESVGLALGTNSREPTGDMWIGDSGSPYQFTFQNDGDDEVGVICWQKDRMFHIREESLIFSAIPSGKSLTVSAAKGFSGGCGPVYSNSKCSFSGIIDDSILEFTANNAQYGVYQISREVNMKGRVMTATGERGCTSGVKGGKQSCIFGCAGGAATCGEAGSYNLIEGADDSGFCQTGEFNGQPEGGCQFGENGDHVTISLSNDKSWPAASFPVYAGEYSKK